MAKRARMFMGLDLGGHFAWRATKPSYDALTNTAQENFSFNSDWARAGLIHEVGVTDGSGYVFFDPLPFVPQVLAFRRNGSNLFASEAGGLNWIDGSGGVASAYWPSDIRTDRFVMVYLPSTPTPLSFPYIVFKVPIIGA